MAVGEGKFLEIEKRKSAFKYVFNVLQTNASSDVSGEQFETGPQIYSDALITGDIARKTGNKNASNVLPYKIRTWVTGSGTGYDALWDGYFSESIYDTSGANPNVELVIMPLAKLVNTNNQMYFAYDPKQSGNVAIQESDPEEAPWVLVQQEYDREIVQGTVFNTDSQRLKSWINPARYGSAYQCQIKLTSLTDPDHPTISATSLLNNTFNNENNSYGGYVFDYGQGALYLGLDIDAASQDDPVNISSKTHPLWIQAYRYIGPTGSNMTVATASYALNAGTAGSSGTGGVSTTLVSVADQFESAYDVNKYSWYKENTFTATDSKDIIEYVSKDGIVMVSKSFGERDLVVRLGSSSYNDITYTEWPYMQESVGIYNTGNIFKFSATASLPDLNVPDLSSFALYETPPLESGLNQLWITQSFDLGAQKRLARVGLFYSDTNNLNIGLTGNDFPESTKYPAGYILEGSVDGQVYTKIASASGIRTNTLNGTIDKLPGIPHIKFNDNNTDGSQYYWLNNSGGESTAEVRVYCATASVDMPADTAYQFFRLYVSGGLRVENGDSSFTRTMALHHFDMWENLDFGPTNRKQLNVKFNNTLTGITSHVTGEPLTEFDLLVSQSAAKVGYVEFVPPEVSFFTGGDIANSINLAGNLTFTSGIGETHIKGATSITASIVSASSNIKTDTLNVNQIDGPAYSIAANGNASFNELQANGFAFFPDTASISHLILGETLNVSGSDIILGSDNNIFLTNKRQDGSDGTDEFSARIFGNYVDVGGVSDMYLDAYRIYAISDAKVDIRTLHPTLGKIVLQSPQTHVSGSLYTSQSIFAGSITASHGMQLSGPLRISGSIIPNTAPNILTSSFDLGSSTAAWHDIHVSDGTIRFYDGQKEVINMSVDSDKKIQFKSGSEFQTIKAGRIDLTPSGSTTPNVQLSDQSDVGFIAVMSDSGKYATILRAENQSYGPLLGSDSVHGSLTQKGSGSFAIILDAVNQNNARSKFTVMSNSEFFSNAQLLFQVSESGETKAYGYLNVSQSVNANSFTGIFSGALSSSAQISTDISGAFNEVSNSLQSRIASAESELGNTLLSGSAQIAAEISGAFTPISSSLQNRLITLEVHNHNTYALKSAVSGAFNLVSASLESRINTIESIDHSSFITTASFEELQSDVGLKASTTSVQRILNATGSFAVTGSDVIFGQISSSNINVAGTISASNFHTTIFNPTKITTTEFTASLVNLGDLSNTRTFTTDDYNILFAASTRPALTVRNTGGSNITYFGSPVDNADAFIKFQADRSSTTFAMGIDSHDSTFKIAEGTYLNENSGFAPFSIKNNKVAILQSNDPAYPLDVAGDIRSTGTMRVDTIKGQTFPYTSIVLESNVTTSLSISSSATITANAFVGDGTNLTGVATTGTVVLNSATASFVTTTTAIDGGTF